MSNGPADGEGADACADASRAANAARLVIDPSNVVRNDRRPAVSFIASPPATRTELALPAPLALIPALQPRVVNRVGRQLFNPVVTILEGIYRPRLRIDESGNLLRVGVGDVARIQVR